MLRIPPIVPVVLVSALAAGCGSTILPAETRSDVVARLEEVRLEVDGMELQAYRNLSWCMNLVYKQGAFSSDPDNSACNLFEAQPVDFDARAAQDFATLAQHLSGVGVEVTAIRRRSASEYERDRLVFTLADGSSVVYSPEYILPQTDAGETVFVEVDANWYYVWEDWN